MRSIAQIFSLAIALTSGAILLTSSLFAAPLQQTCSVPTIATRQGNGASRNISLSANGNYMAFESLATNLVSSTSLGGEDTNNESDIFVYDIALCETERISLSSAQVQADSDSYAPSISNDGRYVAFSSDATNLVADDTNGFRDIFVFDRTSGTTVRASLSSMNEQGFENSNMPEIAGDGLAVAFRSSSHELVLDDTNSADDMFVRDLLNGSTTRVSVATGGGQGNAPVAGRPSISDSGRYVAFSSFANNLVSSDGNSHYDVFRHDRQTGTTIRISVSSSGTGGNFHSFLPSISRYGEFIAFTSEATNLVSGDTNNVSDIFLRDVATGTTSRVSLAVGGGQANNASAAPSISMFGDIIAFSSLASNLVVGDTNGIEDVFVFDSNSGQTVRRHAAIQPNQISLAPNLASYGLWVGFESDASNLVTNDTNGLRDVFSINWLPPPELTQTPTSSHTSTPSRTPEPAGADLIRNGDFSSGLDYWNLYAAPNASDIVSNVTNGVFQFYRLAGSQQAVVLQNTSAQLPANASLEARFDIANSSPFRKRFTVLIHDADFSDLHVCSFWLAPNMPLQTYQMQTHTTEFWQNAALSIYAATADSQGFYLVDNVSLRQQPSVPNNRTICINPNAPLAGGGMDSGNLLSNHDFSFGLPPWTTFGPLVWQLSSNVFEFFGTAVSPYAGVIEQNSEDAVALNTAVEVQFSVGNSGNVRKRFTVLVRDSDFSDLQACTFWLAPYSPLQTFTLRSHTTETWANAAVSLYAATAGTTPWYQLDNVVLRQRPGLPVVGTECYEPGAGISPAFVPEEPSLSQDLQLSLTPLSTETSTLVPTETSTGMPTQLPTSTLVFTDVPTALPTSTLVLTELPTEIPTSTPVPTELPTNTVVPTDIPTSTLPPTEVPTQAPPTETPTP